MAKTLSHADKLKLDKVLQSNSVSKVNEIIVKDLDVLALQRARDNFNASVSLPERVSVSVNNAKAAVASILELDVDTALVGMGVLATAFGALYLFHEQALAFDAAQHNERADNIGKGLCQWVYQGCHRTHYGKKRNHVRFYDCYVPTQPGRIICDDQLSHVTFWLLAGVTVLAGAGLYLLACAKQGYHADAYQRLSSQADCRPSILNQICRQNGYEPPKNWNVICDVDGQSFTLKEYVSAIILGEEPQNTLHHDDKQPEYVIDMGI